MLSGAIARFRLRSVFLSLLAVSIAAIVVAQSPLRKRTPLSLEYRHRMNDQRLLRLLSELDRGHAEIRRARADYLVKTHRHLLQRGAGALVDALNAEILWLQSDFDIKRANYRIQDFDLEYQLLKSRVDEVELGTEDLLAFAKGIVEVRRQQHRLAKQLVENAHPFADRVAEKAEIARGLLARGAGSYDEWQALDLAAREARGLVRIAEKGVSETAGYVAEAEADVEAVRTQGGSPR